MDSILDTIKQALGVENEYTGFDVNILLDINSALGNLNQLGVGPSEGFVVTDQKQTWVDFLGSSIKLEAVKSYILHKVRLSFDPPSNSFLIDAIQKQIDELGWRLMVQEDPPLGLIEEEIILDILLESNIMEEV